MCEDKKATREFCDDAIGVIRQMAVVSTAAKCDLIPTLFQVDAEHDEPERVPGYKSHYMCSKAMPQPSIASPLSITPQMLKDVMGRLGMVRIPALEEHREKILQVIQGIKRQLGDLAVLPEVRRLESEAEIDFCAYIAVLDQLKMGLDFPVLVEQEKKGSVACVLVIARLRPRKGKQFWDHVRGLASALQTYKVLELGVQISEAFVHVDYWTEDQSGGGFATALNRPSLSSIWGFLLSGKLLPSGSSSPQKF